MDYLEQISLPHYKRLVQVAQTLTAQHDISRLCETILEEARALTHADGGTLYMVEGHANATRLEFAIVRNRTLGLSLGGSSGRALSYPAIPLHKDNQPNHQNVASHTGLTGELVNIDDVYAVQEFDFAGTRAFDAQFGYKTRSVLTVPLMTDFGELVAVLQLLNATDPVSGEVIPFSAEIEPVVRVLASFAAIAIQQQRAIHDQKELLVALSGEPNTGRLLERILSEAQAITHADGGSLYLLREDEKGADLHGGNRSPRLEFALVRNDSLKINQGGSGADISLAPIALRLADGSENHHHVAAHTALTCAVVNIPDAYASEQFDFSGTQAFDKKHGYRSVSFLTIPLMNHLNEVIGVLQLVNARHPKTREIIPFSEYVEPLARALASYAAIALNNLILVQELKNLLDAFIKVIAQAIDAKSPHTSGHCQRVPLLTEMIARAACVDETTFVDFNFDEDGWYELHVAAWLHDCGKLSTPDSVLDKSTKLHTLTDRIDSVETRFAVMRMQKENDMLRAIIAAPDQRDVLQKQLDHDLVEMADDLAFIQTANKGGEFMAEESKDRVRKLAQYSWLDSEGKERPLLDEDEVYNLCIERGTLTHEERQVINNHMQVTIDMLESLPFPRKLRRVPEYAGGHHEKMDGSGFPRGLTRQQMSLPARMMAIADIFEALTAKDRPYKDPMKISQALSILKKMREGDHIDPDLYELFLRQRVWEKYAKQVLDDEQLDVTDPSPYF
ncbi:MAG: GAF domain-containing protein [Gammaproteobacteria bacterium]|nr:GAF domain-containing protein [Gammaproteobacteria bacterium]MBQ0775106.1 GAF domain-containing protein [Gammaproteobacteria bacterium]|tara:strand:- start:78884 stop:81079 length:2196 start_codon:yes stop_codon:yes gene_type:complete